MRQSMIICCVVSLLSAVACVVLPIIGANSFFSNFRIPYSGSAHARLLGGQLVGPLFTIALCSLLLWSFARKKILPWWIAAIGLIGSIYAPFAVGPCSHDFSHTVFSECSDIYVYVIGWLSAVSGLALFATCLLMRAEKRIVNEPPKPNNSRLGNRP
jgi:hypothetical protein